MPTAIVSGALANKPFNGGEAWVRLSWVLGPAATRLRCLLRRGVCKPPPAWTTPARAAEFVDFGQPRSLRRGDRATSASTERAGLLCDGGREAAGLGLAELATVPRDAELLVNISGHLTMRRTSRGAAEHAVYVDLDPGFTQVWHADRRPAFRARRARPLRDRGAQRRQARLPHPRLRHRRGSRPCRRSCSTSGQRPHRPRGRRVSPRSRRWRSPYGRLEIDGRTHGPQAPRSFAD